MSKNDEQREECLEVFCEGAGFARNTKKYTG